MGLVVLPTSGFNNVKLLTGGLIPAWSPLGANPSEYSLLMPGPLRASDPSCQGLKEPPNLGDAECTGYWESSRALMGFTW